jgi:Ca2+-binding RTX toxin-like protein
MEGADGNDILIGGGGQDQMWGGAGNDSYYVDGQDVVMQDDRGQDRVFASASFEIQSDCIRTLTLTGSAATDGTGNQLANLIIGNGAANTLAGLDGADKLRGGAGGDVLYGGNGRDILTGGKGRDDFVFYQSLSPSSRDKITDFNHRDDSIGLENAIMSKLGDGGHSLNRDFFHVGAAAADANDYVIYNSRNGHLSYDANGNEHGDMFLLAILSHGPALQANDFHVI